MQNGLNVEETAKKVNLKVYKVRKLLQEGYFPRAQKNHLNQWVVPQESITFFLEQEKQKKKEEEKKEKTYTVKEVAEVTGKCDETIKIWLRQGIFKNAYKEGHVWRIPKSDVESLPESNQLNLDLVKKSDELIGKRYADLTILKVLGYRPEGNTQQQRLFVEVGCECGNILEKPFYVIERGAIKRCGRDCFLNANVQLGDRFGFLTVIGEGEIRKIGTKGKTQRFLEVKCDCGNEKPIRMSKIKKGEQTSCGKKCKLWLKDITGQKFNYLTVLREDKSAKKRRHFICKCDCGNEATKEMSKITSGHTKFCGNACILQKGENSPSWNPNLTMEERLKGRDYWEYTQWRISVYKRDKFTCQCCGKRGGGNISAHHKDGYHWCVERRIDIANGVTLCEDCHKDFHQKYGFGNNTEKQYEGWIKNKKVVKI